MNSVCVRIFGDICSDRGYARLFTKESVGNIFGDSLDLIRSADIAIANLECPLTDRSNPIQKTGPCLIGPPETASKLSEAGFSGVCIGNNHIMDQGSDGLHDTLKICREAGISTFGAGKHLSDAREPLIVEKKGIRVGFYSMAESEFSIASENVPGANPIDQDFWCEDLQILKEKTDAFIVLLHAGKENYPFPPPKLQSLCRSIVRHGACCVVCQHSHCIGAIEKYENSCIVYGQGNCLFEQSGSRTIGWNTGCIVDIVLKESVTDSFNFHYYGQFEEIPIVRMLRGEKLAKLITIHEQLNEVVIDTDAVRKKWRSVADQEGPRMLLRMSGFNGIILKILFRTKIYKMIYSKGKRTAILNLIRCQTHRELLEQYLS